MECFSPFSKAQQPEIKTFSQFFNSSFLKISLINFTHFLFALSVTTQLATKIPDLFFKYSQLSHLSV